jgi:tRNA(Met) C34 N-acetyltransferase TmcA
VQLPGVISFEFVIQNTTGAAYTITVQQGSGGSAASGHTLTIAQSNSKRFSIQITNTTPGSEAYVLRNLGGYTT